MKIEKQKPKKTFEPITITITIESEKEYDMLKYMSNRDIKIPEQHYEICQGFKSNIMKYM